jgi:diguanylate cyclase (GGDEF)-like protein
MRAMGRFRGRGCGGRRVVIGLLAAVCLPAQAALTGDPAFTRIVPTVDVFPQNFAIAQHADSTLYVGNTEGVLVFDGEHWDLVPLPNGDLVRSLAFDGGHRMYVGGYNAFGYLLRDETGREVYHDLTPLFDELLDGETFGDIWDIRPAREGVFFRALRHVFLYEPAAGTGRLWRHEGRFGAITDFGDSTLLQFRGEGLKHFTAGQWVPLPGGDQLQDHVWEFLPLPDGGLLALAADGDWRVYRHGRVASYPMPAGFPRPSSISSGVPLADGTLALITDNGLLYVYDPRTSAYRSVRVDPGYLAAVMRANDGGLLVAGEDSVFHVEWPASWTALGPVQGLFGSLHSVAQWNHRWYAMTASGVQVLLRQADGSATFQRMDWSNVETWELLPLDSRTALLAESYQVMLVHDGVARPITHSAFYPRVLRRSRFDPDVVFAGMEPGFAVFRRHAGQWHLQFESAELMQDARVLEIVETAPHQLWLGSERGGVWSLRLSGDHTSVIEARHWSGDEGIEYGELVGGNVSLMPDGTLVATTEAGIFQWTGERFEKTGFGGLDAVRDPNEWITVIATAADGTRWAHSYRNIYQDPGTGWKREPLGGLKRGAVEAMTFDDDGAAIFSTGYAILRHSRMETGQAPYAPPVMLRAIERTGADGTRTLAALSPDATLRIPHGDRTLTFRFALPDFRRPDAVRYQARLVGLDDHRPDWSREHTLRYSHLPPGTYTFELRAQDSYGRIAELAPLKISIVPVWYASNWARVLWLLLAAGLLVTATAMLVSVRARRLAAEKLRLERQIAQRTRELRSANRRLETMAHLDGLTGVANRRRLDDYLSQVWLQCAEGGQALSLLAIDVDRFKPYNDTHGHLAGDEVLLQLVATIGSFLERDEDLLARYGGDEFFLVLPGSSADAAKALAERLRQGVEAAQIGVTVSIGIATCVPRPGTALEDLVHAADQALYAAKDGGRNRVTMAPD